MIRGLVILFFLAWPALAAAQEAGVSARVTEDVIEVGGSFQYQADATLRGAADITLTAAPGFGELTVVSQQKFPQIISINGVTERRLSLRFGVVAETIGEFTITPPTFQIGNEALTPEPVKVKVVKAGTRKKLQPKKKDARYFIEATVAPDRAPYVGEQVTLRYDLYIDGAQMDVQPSYSREPSLDDFWIQDLSDRVARQDQMVSVQGRLYKRTALWSYALFPLRAGPIEIEPAEVELVVGSFFRRGQAARLESEALKLEIQPLPPDAPPGFYEGNVGNWSLKVTSDQSQTKVGRAVTIEVQVIGEGQVGRVKLPELPAIAGTRVSDVDVKSTPQMRGTTVGGTRTARYTLTPERAGPLTIPTLEFSFFDPARGEYRTVKSETVAIRVADGELGPAPIETDKLNRRNVSADEDLIANLQGELRPVRSPPALAPAPDPARFPWPYWVLIALAFLALLWIAFGDRVRALTRRTAPEREQRVRSREALDRIGATDDPEKLARALRDGLHEAFDIPRGAVTANDIVPAFEKRGLDLGVAEELAEVLRECEAARFAPSSATLSSGLALRARKLLERLVVAVALLIAFVPSAKAADLAQQQSEAADVAETNPNSVDAQFNLGTTAALASDFGTARLALERATYLAPWDDDVEHNRAIVERIVRLQTIERSRTGRTMDGDETLFWWRVASHVNPHLLGLGTTLLWLLAAACIRLRRRTASPAVRDAAVVGLAVLSLLALVGTVGSFGRTHVLDTTRPVVVLAKTMELREGPNEAAQLKRTPPAMVPGTMVRVTDEREGWIKVTWHTDAGWTRSGAVGWVN